MNHNEIKNAINNIGGTTMRKSWELRPSMLKPELQIMHKIRFFNQTSDSIITVRIKELHNKTWIESPHAIVIFIDKLTINYKDTTHKFNSMAQLMQYAYNI